MVRFLEVHDQVVGVDERRRRVAFGLAADPSEVRVAERRGVVEQDLCNFLEFIEHLSLLRGTAIAVQSSDGLQKSCCLTGMFK